MSDILSVRGEKFDNAAGLSPRPERGNPPPLEPRDSAELTPEIRTGGEGGFTASDTCPGYPPETAEPSADTPHHRREVTAGGAFSAGRSFPAPRRELHPR